MEDTTTPPTTATEDVTAETATTTATAETADVYEFPALFKLVHNRRYVYRLRVEKEDDGSSVIISEYGYEGRSVKSHKTPVSSRKAAAKNFATAVSRAKTTFEAQKRKGAYSVMTGDDESDGKAAPAAPPAVDSCMLAKDFCANESKVNYPCFVQPKLDGYRAVFDPASNALVSRTGKQYTAISDALKQELEKVGPLTLDGELYARRDQFEALAVLRKSKLSEDDRKLVDQIRYHVYDVVNETKTFRERNELLQELKDKNAFEQIVFVDTVQCQTRDEIENIHVQHVKDLYEGTVVRNADSLYVKRRSDGLLKLKDFSDAEFEIVGYDETENGELVWMCKTDDGTKFQVPSKGPIAARRKLFAEMESGKVDSIGQRLWVRYFGLTTSGVPQFAKTMRNGLSIRNEKL